MGPVKAPKPVVLEGRYVRLEPLEARHLPGLRAAGDEDPEIFHFMVGNPYLTGWEEWFAEAVAGQAAGRYISWATVLRDPVGGDDAGRVIGSTRYGDIEPWHGRVEIGWTWLAQSKRRTAANTEAKYLQLRHAFDDLGVTRVAFKTDARNERAQRALERIGAVREGVLRSHTRLSDGYLRDTVYYSIIAPEWPAAKARLETRLESQREGHRQPG
jgi:RimJ/RimL family protein N-acetyltransferase